jgi:hypothetical protein
MTTRVAAGLIGLALLVSPAVRLAALQAPAGPAGSGHWEGSMSVQGKELRLEIDLVAKGGAWVGSAGFPDMNAKEIPLSAISVKDSAVVFAISGAPGDPTFKGTLSKDAKTLSGDFTQGPVAGTFTLAWKGEGRVAEAPKNAAVSKDFEGTWEGALDAGGTTLRLIVTLTNKDGAATGTLVSVDQGNATIPLSAITQKGANLTFTVPAVGGSFAGDLKDGQIVGTWTQGVALPLTLKRK